MLLGRRAKATEVMREEEEIEIGRSALRRRRRESDRVPYIFPRSASRSLAARGQPPHRRRRRARALWRARGEDGGRKKGGRESGMLPQHG